MEESINYINERDPFQNMFNQNDDFFSGFGSSNLGESSHFSSFSTSSNLRGTGSTSIKKSTVIM